MAIKNRRYSSQQTNYKKMTIRLKSERQQQPTKGRGVTSTAFFFCKKENNR